MNIIISRVVVYIRDDVSLVRRIYLKNTRHAPIWIDVKLKGGRKIILGKYIVNIYWQENKRIQFISNISL